MQRKHVILEAVRADRVSLLGPRDVGDDLNLDKHLLVSELVNSQIRPEGGVRQPLASRRNVDVGEVLGQVDSVGDELQQDEMSKSAIPSPTRGEGGQRHLEDVLHRRSSVPPSELDVRS